MFCGSFSRCCRLVYSVWLWYWLVIFTYFFKGPDAFKIACMNIWQLNVIYFYSEWGLKLAFTHTSADSTEYHILCFPLRKSWLVAHKVRIFHITYISISYLNFQNSLPVRMKGIVMYNESPFFDVIYAMISPFMKEKTKKRVSTTCQIWF